MRTLAHIMKRENPGSDWVAAGGVDWHKAESYCNEFYINSLMATQA
jgi:hypothetical protein